MYLNILEVMNKTAINIHAGFCVTSIFNSVEYDFWIVWPDMFNFMRDH